MLSSLPTRLINAGPQEAILRLQKELVIRQQELASGRKADTGLALGGEIRRSIQLESTIHATESHRRLNGAVDARLKGIQIAYAGMARAAEDFVSTAVAARNSTGGRNVLREEAAGALSDLARAGNTSIGGFHVFGGQNADTPPLKDVTAPESASARAEIENSFEAHFGFPPDDPSASAITGVQLEAYLAGPFKAVFEGSSWRTHFSSASDETVRVELAPGTMGDASASANAGGIADLTRAYAALSVVGAAALNQDAFTALTDHALGVIASARMEVTAGQAQIGFAEERVTQANARLDDIERVATNAWNAIETADAYETSARIATLMTGLEASYAMTSRLQRLSLINHL
jgi:flagellar hook-associated protein 3 FlgL